MSPLVLVVTIFAVCSAKSVSNAPSYGSVFPKVLTAVKKSLEFFSSDYAEINVDGLFGLRVGQGQLIQAKHECKQRGCDARLMEKLDRFNQVLDDTCSKALPYIEANDPKYYERFKITIDQPYLLNFRPQTFGNVDDVKVGKSTEYNEEKGDACYARLMGTYKENERFIPKCNTTGSCLDMMTEQNTGRYIITHQLLYFIVVEHVNCIKDDDDSILSRRNVDEIEYNQCKKIYKEANNLAAEGKVSPGSQDLFLEQTALCGNLGFIDFFKPEWMEIVLKMQHSKGCFKMASNDPGLFERSHQKMKKLTTGFAGRKLLREQRMHDGCLSHKSGLGFAVLSSYLRYLIRVLH